MENFGEQAYFVNIPSKFINTDGWTLWLCYTANFAANSNGLKVQAKPPGSRYGMCLKEIKLQPTHPALKMTVMIMTGAEMKL